LQEWLRTTCKRRQSLRVPQSMRRSRKVSLDGERHEFRLYV
jgi:hypothetical protein